MTPAARVSDAEDRTQRLGLEREEMVAELARLQEWIPVRNFRRVIVNVVWWREFRATYTGSDAILGFYNGKITVPFAGISRYAPEVVSILTHELCHAMIAQATNDQAPRWFQEGLAQRVEMRIQIDP